MLMHGWLRFDLKRAIIDAPLISAPFFLVFVRTRWSTRTSRLATLFSTAHWRVFDDHRSQRQRRQHRRRRKDAAEILQLSEIRCGAACVPAVLDHPGLH